MIERILVDPDFLFRAQRAPAAPARARRIADATWTSRRGCRSSCGAAFPTTSCSTLAIARAAARAGGRSSGRSAGCWPTIASCGARHELRRPVALAAQHADARARPEHLPRLRRQPARRRFRPRPAVPGEPAARRSAACSSCSPRTTRSSTSGWPGTTASPDVYGSHFRRVTFADDRRAGLLGQGSVLTVTSYRAPDVAGGARQVAARKPARRAAAAAAGRRAGAPRERRKGRQADVRARAARAASEEPDLRELPRADGSARFRARELRRDRQVAHDERERTRRSTRRACCRTGRSSTGRRSSARRCSTHRGEFIGTLDREAADVRARPRPRVLRHAGGACDRAAGGRATTTGGRRSCCGIVESTPFQMSVVPGTAAGSHGARREH